MEITFEWFDVDRHSQSKILEAEQNIRKEISRCIDHSVSKLSVEMYGDPRMISFIGIAYDPSRKALVKITYPLTSDRQTDYQPLSDTE